MQTEADPETKKIFVNIETTGFFSKNPLKAEICQIATLDHTGERKFCRYIVPQTARFHSKASERSGFTLDYRDGTRILLLNERPVDSELVTGEKSAIYQFAQHISDTTANKIVLFGYSSNKHDRPFILSAFERHRVQLKVPVHIIDVLPFLQALRKSKNVSDPFGKVLASSKNLQRQTVHQSLKGETSYNNHPTHDAVRDVKQLKDIVTHDDFPFKEFNDYVTDTIVSQAVAHGQEMRFEESSQSTEDHGGGVKCESTTIECPPKARKRKRSHPISDRDQNSTPQNSVKKLKMSVDDPQN